MGVDEPSRSSGRSTHLKNGSSRPPVEYGRRQRRLCLQGTGSFRCAWVRDALYQWFVSIRYSVDWNSCEGKARSSGQPKCLARFTRGLLRQKLKQLMIDYCSQCLVRGKRPTTFQPTARWFSGWQRAYGLSMRRPNRKYKVPKAVMAERLEIGWINVARVRALCLAEHGYDPEIENWDQSPFHHNESGSQNMTTLAVAGRSATVPSSMGHAATRMRWAVNLTTLSNEDRLNK